MGDVADLLMPKLGLTMTEGTVARWLVAPGERFGVGDIIVVIETDKIANEVEAPAAGEMTMHLASEGDVLAVGAPIAQWQLEGTDAKPREIVRETLRNEAVETASSTASQPAPIARSRDPSERVVATPYARRLARETEIDLAIVAGSGPNGRIKGDDVLRAKAAQEAGRQIAPQFAAVERLAPAGAMLSSFSFISADVDVGPLRAIDARIAGARDRAFERVAYIALACAKVLGGDGDIPVRLCFERSGALVGIAGSSRDTLSAITARIADAQPVSRSSEGEVAIFVVEGRGRLLVPAIPSGWRMALGVGGVRSARGTDDTHEMTLTVTYDTSVLDHASAAGFLDRIAALLEEPLHLLAA